MHKTLCGKRLNFLEDQVVNPKTESVSKQNKEEENYPSSKTEDIQTQYVIRDPTQFISKLKKVKDQRVKKESFFSKRVSPMIQINFDKKPDKNIEIPLKILDFLTKIDDPSALTSKVLVIKRKMQKKLLKERYSKRREIIKQSRQNIRAKISNDDSNKMNHISEEIPNTQDAFEVDVQSDREDWVNDLVIVDDVNLMDVFVKDSDISDEDIPEEDSNHEDNPINDYPDTPEISEDYGTSSNHSDYQGINIGSSYS